MGKTAAQDNKSTLEAEIQQWKHSLEYVLAHEGKHRASLLLSLLNEQAALRGVEICMLGNTPHINTIPPENQPPYPGDIEIEKRLINAMRWNAMATVVRANRRCAGIGGHISTFASSSTLWEVGFNHFWRAANGDHPGDLVFYQGHGSPGVYARAFLEGRFDSQRMDNFRRELQPTPGLSSYPHPWLMPDFWEMPTVSMGLTSITAIYQARFAKYLTDRGLCEKNDAKVWALLGDGEMDEPESTGAIHLAGNQKLDNLIFVMSCNLQRLDGPVRGNSSVVQEMERSFRGAGWQVIKVLWSEDWDDLIAADTSGKLLRRMGEVCDGEYQKYVVEGGAYMREHFFGKYPELLDLVKNISDDRLASLRRGGHDMQKVYAAYMMATKTKGRPTLILAQTVKGYGQGEAGEALNVAHKQTSMNTEQLKAFRNRLDVPVSDSEIEDVPYYHPGQDSAEIKYLKKRREALGGSVPARNQQEVKIDVPQLSDFGDLLESSGTKTVSTTITFVRLLGKLLRDPLVGKYIVPIVPDEARTFGMEALFRQCGIYSHVGQRYEPVDSDMMLYYREIKEGQILEEGITEAGCMASFVSAGSSYFTRGIPMIPFFVYYSMFGFQRVGDSIWAAADTRSKGFLIGATSGKTTLNGEGLQHQDGHSHLFASAYPNVISYDPATSYEVATIVMDGLRRMYQNGEQVMYYITVGNERQQMPQMPLGCADGIRKGMYKFASVDASENSPRVNLLASGSIFFEAIKAQQILSEKYGVASDLWSVTSWNEITRDAMAADRQEKLHPGTESQPSYISQCLENTEIPVIAASDYVRAIANQLCPYIDSDFISLGTDGFGRSESREALRNFFEVDAKHIAYAALVGLSRQGKFDSGKLSAAIKELKINPDQPASWTV